MQSTAPQHPPVRQRILSQVFIPTAAIVIALLALAAFAPEMATRWFTAAKSWAANDAGWFTILAVAGFLVFVVGCALAGLAGAVAAPVLSALQEVDRNVPSAVREHAQDGVGFAQPCAA